jgi:hypothetical protein
MFTTGWIRLVNDRDFWLKGFGSLALKMLFLDCLFISMIFWLSSPNSFTSKLFSFYFSGCWTFCSGVISSPSSLLMGVFSGD